MAERSRSRREEIEVQDSSRRSAMHGTGKQCLELPSGLSMWRGFKEGSRNIDVIAFKVTSGILKFQENLRFAMPGKWYGECSYWAHSQIGVSPQQYTCPARTFGLKCPICEDVHDFYESPHKEDKKKASKLKAKDRQIFLIYDHEQKERGVQLWEVANWNFGMHLDKFTDGARPQDKAAYKQYYHPYDGYTIRMTASQQAIEDGKPNTIWTPHAFYKRDEDLPESIIFHGYDPHSMVKCLSYDELDAIYRGEVDRPEPGAGETADRREPERQREREPERQREPERERIQTRSEPEKPREEQRKEPERQREPEKTKEPEHQTLPSKKDEKVEFGEKDLVSFMFMDRRVEGVIESVDRKAGSASVMVTGQKRPLIFDFEELTVVIKSDPSFDLKDTLKDDPGAVDTKEGDGKSSRMQDWDDSEDNRVKKPKRK